MTAIEVDPNDDDEATVQTEATRTDTSNVRRYLESLEQRARDKSNGGHPTRTNLQAAEKELARIPERMARATNVTDRLRLTQRRMTLVRTIEELRAAPDLEAAFVESAKRWADKFGVEYAAFREFGVSAEVLKLAGIGMGATPYVEPATGKSTTNVTQLRPKSGVGSHSSPGELRETITADLRAHGDVYDESGQATLRLRERAHIQQDARWVTSTLKKMEDDGVIRREVTGKRTYRIALGSR